jgi:CheY-like chemotaxis protein
MTTIARPTVTTFEVLVVDPEAASLAVVTDSVSGLARVRHVPDGYQAIYELSAHQFDVVVLELFLPGLNGVDLLHRMRREGMRVPAVVVSHSRSAHPEFDGLGVRHVLHKPVSADTLRALLTDVLTPGRIRTDVKARPSRLAAA